MFVHAESEYEVAAAECGEEEIASEHVICECVAFGRACG